MGAKEIMFDDDVKQLVHLLLRKHAKENNDFNKYDNIGSRLSFEIANRGLSLMGFTLENPAPIPEKR